MQKNAQVMGNRKKHTAERDEGQIDTHTERGGDGGMHKTYKICTTHHCTTHLTDHEESPGPVAKLEDDHSFPYDRQARAHGYRVCS